MGRIMKAQLNTEYMLVLKACVIAPILFSLLVRFSSVDGIGLFDISLLSLPSASLSLSLNGKERCGGICASGTGP